MAHRVDHSCGNVGKLTRIAAAVEHPEFGKEHPRKNPASRFLVLGGYADFITSSAFVQGHGAITGLANIAPVGIQWVSLVACWGLTGEQHASVKLFELSEAAMKDLSILPEAQRLQGILARADFTIAKASISGTKFLIERLFGYGGSPRKPLPPMDPEDGERLWKHPDVQALFKTERDVAMSRKL